MDGMRERVYVCVCVALCCSYKPGERRSPGAEGLSDCCSDAMTQAERGAGSFGQRAHGRSEGTAGILTEPRLSGCRATMSRSTRFSVRSNSWSIPITYSAAAPPT